MFDVVATLLECVIERKFDFASHGFILVFQKVSYMFHMDSIGSKSFHCM